MQLLGQDYREPTIRLGLDLRASAGPRAGHIRPAPFVSAVTDRPAEGWRMDEEDWLTEQFEANRNHLRAVAYRMLGSPSEADDAVQETWVRLSRADTGEVTNLGG